MSEDKYVSYADAYLDDEEPEENLVWEDNEEIDYIVCDDWEDKEPEEYLNENYIDCDDWEDEEYTTDDDGVDEGPDFAIEPEDMDEFYEQLSHYDD